MSATPKVGMHLGVIGLHPLHSPPFVKVCFTPKHTLGLMGIYISHFVADPMLGLRHSTFGTSKLLLVVGDSMHQHLGLPWKS